MRLQGVVNFQRPRLAHLLEANLRDYFDWGCVQAGGFVDVPVTTPGTVDAYADSTFSPAVVEGVADYRTWRSPHRRWCSERGLADMADPIRPDGVYVDGTFYSAADRPHAFDFVRGCVTFDAPLLPNSLVQAAYSYRRAPFTTSDNPWFERVVMGGWEFESGGGDSDVASVLSRYDVPTPVCVVEYAGSRKTRGVMLGSTARQGVHAIKVHVLAGDRYFVKHMLDVVTDQMGATLRLYDVEARRTAGDFDLDAAGSPRPDATSYPGLLDAYPYDEAYIQASFDSPAASLRSLFLGTASLDVVTRRGDV